MLQVTIGVLAHGQFGPPKGGVGGKEFPASHRCCCVLVGVLLLVQRWCVGERRGDREERASKQEVSACRGFVYTLLCLLQDRRWGDSACVSCNRWSMRVGSGSSGRGPSYHTPLGEAHAREAKKLSSSAEISEQRSIPAQLCFLCACLQTRKKICPTRNRTCRYGLTSWMPWCVVGNRRVCVFEGPKVAKCKGVGG